MKTIRLIVSACLAGDTVRYDGKNKPCSYVADQLARAFELIKVCPECEAGFPVPREAVHLTGTPEHPELCTVLSGLSRTVAMHDWLNRRMVEIAQYEPSGFILKSSSPSCGLNSVPINGGPARTSGFFAGCVQKAFPELAIASDKQLETRMGRQKFLDKVLLMSRFRELISTPEGIEALGTFHKSIKLCVMTHAPGRMNDLERFARRADWGTYERKLCMVLDAEPEQSKHDNVWRHLASVILARGDDYERAALLRSQKEFSHGELDFKAMLMVLRYGVEKYAPEYQDQFYWRELDPLY